MKKLYTILLAVCLYINASAQWSIIFSNTIAPIEELRGCYFMNASTGIVVGAQTVVGNSATIRRTTDGGATWANITNIYTDTLRSVWFIDDTVGFACGAKGRIIKTLNGGLVWDTVASGVTNLLRCVHFPSLEIGYICGGGGVILKTADGGITWNQQVTPLTQDLINIRFLNEDTGYASSSLGTFLSGYVLRTFDGGTNWSIVYTDAQGLLGIGMANDSTIVSGGGNQTIVRSTDRGQTWSTVYTGSAGTNFRGCWFRTPTTGYMVGDIGSLFQTTNAGANWAPVSPTSAGLLGIHFPNADTGYAVGNGVIIKYTTPCMPDTPAAIIPGSAVLCSFDTVTFCVPPIPNATSYQWIMPGGNTILSGQGDTCVTVVLGNQTSGNISCNGVNACGPGGLILLSITVEQAPAAPTISLVGSQLMSDTAANIQWYLNGVPIAGETNQYHTPLQNGSYTVVYTNPVGCTAISTPYDLFSVDIHDVNSSGGIFVYPNPVDNELFISKSSSTEKYLIDIYDLIGKKLVTHHLQSTLAKPKTIALNVSELAPGIYFLKVKNGMEARVMRFVKR